MPCRFPSVNQSTGMGDYMRYGQYDVIRNADAVALAYQSVPEQYRQMTLPEVYNMLGSIDGSDALLLSKFTVPLNNLVRTGVFDFDADSTLDEVVRELSQGLVIGAKR